MCRRKVIAVTKYERIFTVTWGPRFYFVVADPWMTLDLIWSTQKCLFMPGSIVTITDDKGNSKTFEKE